MDDRTVELSLVQLIKTTRELALPAEEQLLYDRRLNTSYELADDFSNWCGWALGSADLDLSDRQRSLLESIDAKLDAISGPQNESLWTDHALAQDHRWAKIRDTARALIQESGWV